MVKISFAQPGLAGAEQRRAIYRLGMMSAAFAGSDAARAAIAFAMSVAVGRGLGADAFGRWTLCLAWASTLTVAFDLGFAALLTRETAKPAARVGALIGSALTARGIAFLPAAVIVLIAAGTLVGDPDSIAALRVGVLVAALGLAYGCFAAALKAWPRWLPVILGVETIGLAVQCAAAVAIVRSHGGIVALLAVAAAVQAAQLAIGAWLWRRASARRDRVTLGSVRIAWREVRRALPFAAAGLTANAQSRLAPIALGFASTSAQVAAFGVAWQLGNTARRLPHAVFGAALPVLTREAGRAPARGRRLHATLDRSVSLFAAAAMLLLIAWPGPILRATYGSSFADAAPALRWMGLALLPLLTNASRKIYLYARGDESIALGWSIAALVIQSVATLLLIPRFGATGAAAALALSEAIVFLPLNKTVQPHRRRSEDLRASVPEDPGASAPRDSGAAAPGTLQRQRPGPCGVSSA